MITKKQRKASRFYNDVVRMMNRFGYAKAPGHQGRQIPFSNHIGKQVMLQNMAALTLPQKKG